MHLTIALDDDRVVTVEVDGDETVATLKAIVEADTGLPAAEQALMFSGTELADNVSLVASSVKEGDLLVCARRGGTVGGGGAAGGQNPLAVREDGSLADPAAALESVRSNAQTMAQLASHQPELHSIISAGDADRFAELMQRTHAAELHRRRQAQERQRQEEAELWNADPFDADAQKRIAERIQQEHITHNYEMAYEHNPETFVAVDMLYVRMSVNKEAVEAFVDSGAQSTIMGLATVERLGLGYLIDKRFAGVAKGVGAGKIVGKIHQAMMKVHDQVIATSITVLESNDMPFLFGLDMLRRHACQIDLKANVLRFTHLELALPFLQPHEMISKAFGRAASVEHAAASSDAAGPSGSPAANAAGPFSSAAADAATAAGAAAAARAAAGAPAPSAAMLPTAQPSAAMSSAPSLAEAQLPAPGGGNDATSAGAAPNEASLQQLVNLGFPRQQAVEALAMCGGNADAAASILFGGF